MPLFLDAPAVTSLGSMLAKEHTHFLLNGTLGMGKTTFTKGVASFLGIDPDEVQSPTYTYLAIYQEKLLHIDMRRIENEAHFLSLDLLPLLQHYPYVVIERPKRTQHYATPTRLHVEFTEAEKGRTIVRSPFHQLMS